MYAQRNFDTSDYDSITFPKRLSVHNEEKDLFQNLKLRLSDIQQKVWPSEESRKEDYLRQLFYLALSDNKLSEGEWTYILELGLQIQVKEYRVIELAYHSTNWAPLFLRLPKKDRFFYIFHLIKLVSIEEQIPQKAISRAQSLLMKQGYAPDTVDIILATIERNKEAGATYQQTYDQLRESLS